MDGEVRSGVGTGTRDGRVGDPPPTPIVALNRAVVVAEVDGPAPVLSLVSPLPLACFHVFHAVRADHLRRLRRDSRAALACDAAIAAAPNASGRTFLVRRRAMLGGV